MFPPAGRQGKRPGAGWVLAGSAIIAAVKLEDLQAGASVRGILNSGEARRRADALQTRLRRRLRELRLEARLAPLPPVMLGGVLVAPRRAAVLSPNRERLTWYD